jgi:hypothetical protein
MSDYFLHVNDRLTTNHVYNMLLRPASISIGLLSCFLCFPYPTTLFLLVVICILLTERVLRRAGLGFLVLFVML